jgi:uncharacterized membrane protein
MLKKFLVTFGIFIALDGVWLTVVAKNFYAQQLGYLMTDTPNLAAAGIFYLIYIVTLLTLVITPALKARSLQHAIMNGALFGLCAYATYDLTNLATIRDWPMLVTVVDLIWGTVLSASVAGASYWVLAQSKKR